MPHNPTHRKTLMDIWSKGEYKTSADLPTFGQAWGAYEKKFQKGVTEGGKNIFGQKVGPLKSEDLQSMVMGVAGGGAQIGKGAAKWGINRILQVAEKGQPSRSVVAVQMSKGGKEWLQPFYKSSGTSIKGSGKEGKWMPFMGRQTSQNLPGSKSGKRFYKDTAGGTAIGAGEGWWVKGWQTGKDKWDLLASSSYRKGSDPLSHAGPYKGISKEISRLEKTGYFKHAGTAKTSKQVNKWLEGYGFDRPRSMSW
jgi:hypothetical protein